MPFDPAHARINLAQEVLNSDESSSEKTFTAPRLTLSAFRRPEATVRITNCNPSQSINDKYVFRNKVLGYGASSTVRLAIRRCDKARVAVKCIPKYVVLRDLTILEEITLLRKLNHPNIVKMLDVYETDAEIQLVMEYCQGGELYDAVQTSSFGNLLESHGETAICKVITQILLALEYLHARSIVHRDVKPENVLLFSNDGELKVKLSDFGLATTLDEEPPKRKRKLDDIIPLVRSLIKTYSRVGSHYYSAPEIKSGIGYGTSVDIYSVGVTSYILICGHFPPDFNQFREPQWKLVSSQAKDLIRSMLDPNPIRRITAREALHQDWIAKENRMYKEKINRIYPKKYEVRVM